MSAHNGRVSPAAFPPPVDPQKEFIKRGLDHEDAARFAFLLATPAILGAGLYKMPDLLRPEMRGSLGPAMVCLVVAGIAAYFSVRFLTGYFEKRTLTPFGIYCLVAGIGSLAYFTLVR